MFLLLLNIPWNVWVYFYEHVSIHVHMFIAYFYLCVQCFDLLYLNIVTISILIHLLFSPQFTCISVYTYIYVHMICII